MYSAEKIMGAKGLVILLVFLMARVFFCTEGYASDSAVMYLKQQSFSYLFPEVNRDYAVAAYGKGEQIAVHNPVTVEVGKKKQVFYQINHLGRPMYIPQNVLTAEKPRWPYRSKIVFRQLQLKENTKLYTIPCCKSKYKTVSECELYTIGETRYWYKVFRSGKVWFVKKADRGIAYNTAAEFPNIRFSGISASAKSALKDRVKYIYAMLPEQARIQISGKLKCIHVVKVLPDQHFRNMGAAAYACSDGNIYLKEDLEYLSFCTVEGSLLHELGHMLLYTCKDQKLMKFQEMHADKKRNDLNLRSYYLQEKEYLAETFEIYVKDPFYLKRQAEETYRHLSRMLN